MPGEDRRPTLSWPRNIPIEGEPADVVAVVNDYGKWLAESDVPKLFINSHPGALVRGRLRDFVRSWPNQTESQFPECISSRRRPDEIGAAVAQFVRRLRSNSYVAMSLPVTIDPRYSPWPVDASTSCTPSAHPPAPYHLIGTTNA